VAAALAELPCCIFWSCGDVALWYGISSDRELVVALAASMLPREFIVKLGEKTEG
jgi:hypothetical protein